MQNELLARRLKYHIFSGNPTGPEQVELYNSVYQFWHSVWSHTFSELDGLKELYSDDFVRQSEKTFLTYNGEIIAYFSHTWFNLDLLADQNHSYFVPYQKEYVDKMKEMGFKDVMVMGWLSVHPKWRKNSMGSLIAESILRQAYFRFLESESDALIAYTRNDRKINQLCYQYGSRCLKSNLRGHNVDIDLIYTLKDDVKDHSDELIRKTCNRLWQNKIIYQGAPTDFRRRVAL